MKRYQIISGMLLDMASLMTEIVYSSKACMRQMLMPEKNFLLRQREVLVRSGDDVRSPCRRVGGGKGKTPLPEAALILRIGQRQRREICPTIGSIKSDAIC